MSGKSTHAPDDGAKKVRVVVGDYNAIAEKELDALAKGHRDPFRKRGEKIKELGGLSATTKRRISRNIKKYATGTSSDAGTKQEYEQLPTGYALFDLVEPPFNMEYLAKLYEISAAHHAAVNAKVVNTVGLGVEFRESLKTKQVISRAGDDEKKLDRLRRRVEKAREEMFLWLEDVNSEDTFDEILWKVCTDLETTGNGYLEVGRKSNGNVGYIGHIPSTTLRRRVARDGYVQIVANKTTFFRNYGEDTPDPIGGDPNPNEIIHFMKYTPTDTYYGIPDVVAARNAIAGIEFAERFNLDYFEHKAVPRYMVVLKGAELDEDGENMLMDFLSTGLKGNHHRTVYFPLPADTPESKVELKMEAIESGVQDSSFTKYNEFNRDVIFMAHRVPISQTGINSNVSLGAVRDATRMFKEQVIRPQQRVWESRLKPLFREITDVFDFKLTELTLTDEETQSKIDERHLRWGVKVPNEVRQAIKLAPRDGGDDPVDMATVAERKEQRTRASGNRRRDQERTGGPDDNQSAEGRREQGSGSAAE